MQEQDEQQETSGVTRKESLAILGASVMAAASALLATVIAKQVLTGTEVTEFLVFWSLLFGAFGIIAGMQQEVTRAVGATRLPGYNPAQPGVRVMGVVAGIGAVVALLVAVTSPLWAPSRVPTSTPAVVALISAGLFLYAFHAAMSGASAGRGRWYQFATYGGGEALWRLLAMAAVGFTAGSLLGLEIAVVSTVLLWCLMMVCSADVRRTFATRADVGARKLTGNMLFAMGSSAASAVLMMGFPAIMTQTETDASAHTLMVMAALILAISITRSPIMIPLQAFQGVAVAAFLKQQHRPLAAMAKPAAALLGVGAVGGVLAALVGPWLFLLIYPPRADEVAAYGEVATPWVLGLLTFGSAIMALLVLSGTVVIALGAHRLYITGWVVAAALAVVLVYLLPLPLIPRVIVSLYAAPAIGFAVHLAGMVAIARTRPAPTVTR